MAQSGEMFNWAEEWNISFAGCGFSSVYYLGAVSCILQQVPQLVHGASKICGASSGCLVAAALTVGIPIEQFCADVLTLAREARRRPMGVFHPTFSLLRAVKESLLEKLPADAHRRASGRLCVSLTRVADGKNVLVSEFNSREELIQVLMCSCFFPVYCGFIPPSYRGVLYIDGALSNNQPLCEQSNTVTVAPFSGESDICPREGTFSAVQVHYGNVSIQVNSANVHRICTSFLPPKLEDLAEICHNGYTDALRFLTERELLEVQLAPLSLEAEVITGQPCCETLPTGPNPHEGDHWWLDPQVIHKLPDSFRTVFCEAGRDGHEAVRVLPVSLVLYLLTLLMMPVELSIFLIKSVILTGCAAVGGLLTVTSRCCQTTSEDPGSASSEQRRSSRTHDHPHNNSVHWDNNGNLDVAPPTCTGVRLSNFPAHTPPACGKVTLNHRSKPSVSSLVNQEGGSVTRSSH